MVKESFFAIFFFIAKYDKYDFAIVNGHIRFLQPIKVIKNKPELITWKLWLCSHYTG